MNALPETGGLRDFQAGFAARIRDPEGAPLPDGIPERRMRAYEELLFNNLQGFLQACYPITRKLLNDETWEQVVRQYFIEHRCRSPLFRDIPREFLDWLEPRADALFPGMSFLYEFMHYEWLEMAVSIDSTVADEAAIDPDGDLLTAVAVVNPTSRLACYRYPVHHIGPEFQPQAADGTTYCYLLYRDGDDRVRFIVLNPVTARLFELLGEGTTGRAALLQIAKEINHQSHEALMESGLEQIKELHRAGVLLGTRRGL